VSAVLKMMLVLAAAYAALLALVFIFQHRLVYFPLKERYSTTPQMRGLAFERVTVPTEDGEQLAAWWIPASRRTEAVPVLGTVLMFSGMGYNTLLVDYRGYGESSGEPSEAGTYRDATASWSWLTVTRGVKASDIVIFGESLGGGIATWLAAREKPRALILASTFSSIPDLGVEIYPWLPVRWLSRIHYNNFANFERINMPVLIAHSRDDEIIPYAHGKRLYAIAKQPKVFLDLDGGHNEGFVFAREDWAKAVQAFLAKL